MNESLVTSPQQMEEVKAWPHLPNLLMEQLSWNADVPCLPLFQKEPGVEGLRFRADLYSQDYANHLLLWLQA